MANVSDNRAWFIIRGMTYYVSRIYKREKFQDTSMGPLMEDLYLPRELKNILLKALDRFKNERYVTAHNHCVHMQDRKDHVTGSFRAGLLELAKGEPHSVFLRECTLYIMAATEMEKLGFLEAREIVIDAIYHACINSKQHESLMQWETHPKAEENSEPNMTDHQSEAACNDGVQNNVRESSPDVEIIMEKLGSREIETVFVDYEED